MCNGAGTYFLQNFLSTPAVLSDTRSLALLCLAVSLSPSMCLTICDCRTPDAAGPRRNDLLLQIATVTTYPGYGYHIEQGCTTWPETWDCQVGILSVPLSLAPSLSFSLSLSLSLSASLSVAVGLPAGCWGNISNALNAQWFRHLVLSRAARHSP